MSNYIKEYGLYVVLGLVAFLFFFWDGGSGVGEYLDFSRVEAQSPPSISNNVVAAVSTHDQDVATLSDLLYADTGRYTYVNGAVRVGESHMIHCTWIDMTVDDPGVNQLIEALRLNGGMGVVRSMCERDFH